MPCIMSLLGLKSESVMNSNCTTFHNSIKSKKSHLIALKQWQNWKGKQLQKDANLFANWFLMYEEGMIAASPFRTLFLRLQKKTFPMFDSSHFLYLFFTASALKMVKGLGKICMKSSTGNGTWILPLYYTFDARLLFIASRENMRRLSFFTFCLSLKIIL